LRIFNKFAIIADMKVMTGETLDEIAGALGITTDAVEKRLQTANIKPITRKALYPVGTTDMLRNVPGKGRPPKAKAEEPAKPVKKPKK
jgi:predicted ArsR family transcriptional regulator